MGHGELSKNSTRFSFVIDKQLKKQAEELARKENRSLSNYISTLIVKDLCEKKIKENVNDKNKTIKVVSIIPQKKEGN